MPIPFLQSFKKRLLHLCRIIRASDLGVLLAFSLLNATLLLPYYLFNRSDSHLLPLPGVDLISWHDLFISREHVDVLRVNLEVTVALTLWANLAGFWHKNLRRWFWRIFVIYYYLALIYKSYAGVLIGLYQMEPNIYNDLRFISGGVPFLISALDLPGWYFLVFGFGLTGLFGVIWLGTRSLIIRYPVADLGRGTRGLLAGFALFVVVYSFTYRSALSDPQLTVNSLSAEIAQNIRLSQQSRQVMTAFDVTSPFRTYDYARYSLRDKPDVYLFFLESYGSVLYTRDYFQGPYLELMDVFKNQIEAAGWSATSIFSEAPTWGGGTWISYTSAMFGLPLQEQNQYEALHKTYQQIPYPNIGRYFHTQGYEYVWVSPIQRRISPEREAADHNFFGVDQWITLESMAYHGPLYGWGPSPPDQYTFGYIGDYLQDQNQPTFLVFLTQNSHYPWTPLPQMMDDWRTFAIIDPRDNPLSKDTEAVNVFRGNRGHYIDAMAYTFKTLGEFITNLGNPDAVIVLMGDHQPPAVSYKGDGYGTMVHIISQDEDFLSAFQPHGFTKGLVLNDLDATMAHGGFYSLFVRNLVSSYGVTPQILPPYLPNGLMFTQSK